MKKILALVALVVAASPLAFGQTPQSQSGQATSTADREKMLIEIEKKSWEPLKNKQVEEARKLAAPGYRAIYYGQIKDAEETYKDINDIDMKSISFSDWKVTFPVKDTAIITYKYDGKGSYKGEDTSGQNVATSVWVNIGGEWKQAVYAESRVEQGQSNQATPQQPTEKKP
ncbi:MAG: nuclear transport factor 2 family protein [Pyrinomonadaceae bacterium]|nr:nuclear transport factor 2 family protein [Pyrinomonadaceae bacterium]